MDPSRYFDHAATTFVQPEVRDAMLPWLGDQCGNAHSLHSWGRAAHEAVEWARAQVAQAIGAEDPVQIIFTSGATEANNWVAGMMGDTWAVSPFEHSSMREPASARGAHVLSNTGYALEPTELPVSVMRVNNETGAILEVPQGQRVHSDLTQAIGNIPLNVSGLAFATLSAHKFGGPKGVGILFARDPYELDPLLRGGDQETGWRAGTLNVPGIVGLGEAIRVAVDRIPKKQAHLAELKSAFLEGLGGLDDRIRFQTPAQAAGHILSISFSGLQGETLVIEADKAGFAISSGAACSSRSTEPSHVLLALGVPPEWLRGTIRISFGWQNTAESTYELGAVLRERVNALWNA